MCPVVSRNREMTRTRPSSQIESGKIKTNHILRKPEAAALCTDGLRGKFVFLDLCEALILPKSDRSIKLVVAIYSVKESGNKASALSNVGKKGLSSQP